MAKKHRAHETELERLDREENQYFREGGPREGQWGLNEIQRKKIKTFSHGGKTWLGKINRYPEDRKKPYLVPYRGQKVYNFEYNFALHKPDKPLVRLIKRREVAPLQEISKNTVSIFSRLRKIGGLELYWV